MSPKINEPAQCCPTCGAVGTMPKVRTDAGGETERARILALRAAFVEGVCWSRPSARELTRDLNTIAADRYPLPPRTRPRVVREPSSELGQEWRVVNGQVEWRGSFKREWNALLGSGDPSNIQRPTPERIALWADLLARPTEPVPEGTEDEP